MSECVRENKIKKESESKIEKERKKEKREMRRRTLEPLVRAVSIQFSVTDNPKL